MSETHLVSSHRRSIALQQALGFQLLLVDELLLAVQLLQLPGVLRAQVLPAGMRPVRQTPTCCCVRATTLTSRHSCCQQRSCCMDQCCLVTPCLKLTPVDVASGPDMPPTRLCSSAAAGRHGGQARRACIADPATADAGTEHTGQSV